MANKVFQGHIATDGSTKIICTGSSMVIDTIIINNEDSNYVIEVSRFMAGPGIHEVPIYTFLLDQGDTVRDTDEYILYTNNYIQLITDVPGTTYYISAIEI